MGLDLRLTPTSKFTLGIAIFGIQIFLLVNAGALFGSQAGVVKDTLLIYLVMQLGVMAFSQGKTRIQTNFDQLYNYLFLLLLGSIGLTLVPFVIEGWGLSTSATIAAIVMQLAVVVPVEETVFRDVLPDYMGDLLSSVAFGFFHLAVYDASIPLMVVAMGLGLVFALIRERFGIAGAMGAHAAWNLKALGILDQLIRGTGL